MTIYCEGSAAEITFSLTGGREGRLMSYAPPVEIFFAKQAIRWKVLKTVPFGGGNSANFYHDLFAVDMATIISEDKNTIDGNYETISFGTNSPYSSTVKFSFAGIYKVVFVNNLPLYNPTSNPYITVTKVIWEERWYPNEATDYEYTTWRLATAEKKDNVFCIQDKAGVLYFHQVPEGFTPSYQVNCIGCKAGDCAGSNGQGGVICMDCKQMDRDLQAIKKLLR